MCVAYLEEMPTVELDPNGVSFTYRSGNEVFTRRCSRALHRRYLETSLRQLNDYERAERAERHVVEFAKAGHA